MKDSSSAQKKPKTNETIINKLDLVFKYLKNSSENLTKFLENNQPLVYLCLFVSALIIRIIYIFSINHLPLFDNPTMDAQHHHVWAVDIATKSFIGNTPFIRSPLYPYLLGIIYWLFGINFYLPRFLMAIVGSFTVTLIYHLSKKLFSPLPALISAIIALFSWVLIYYDGEILITSLGLFITLIIINYLLNSFEKPTAKNYFYLGILFGIGALTRTNYLPIIAIFLLFFIFYYRKKILLPLFYLVGVCVIIFPLTLRNYLILDDFIPISFYSGVNFYIGNNPYSDGRNAVVPGTRADWYGGVEDVISIAQQEKNKQLKPSEVSLFWSQKALDFIKNNPSLFFKKTIQKFLYIFDLKESSNNKNIYFFKQQSWLLNLGWFSFFSAFLYIPFAILGIVSAIKKRQEKFMPIFLLLASYIAGLSLFFVYTRLRHPIIGILLIFAGQGIYLFFKKSNWKLYLPLYLVIFLFLFFISSPSSTLKDGYFTLANAYMRQNKIKLAEENYYKTLGLAEPYASRINKNLAIIENIKAVNYLQQEDYTKAEASFLKAIQFEDSVTSRVNLGNLYSLFDKNKAIVQYQKALILDANYLPTYLNLANIYKEIGNKEQLNLIIKKIEKFNLNSSQKQEVKKLLGE